MIELLHTPKLLDYIKVCIRMPADERAQLEAFTGVPYDIDGAAVGNFMAAGLKWGIYQDGEPIAVGGFMEQRPGVLRDFMLTTPEAWVPANWFTVTRMCRRVMDALLATGQAHRLECVSLASRERAFKWYSTLRYNREGTLYGYCANGADAVMFSRVKHGIK